MYLISWKLFMEWYYWNKRWLWSGILAACFACIEEFYLL